MVMPTFGHAEALVVCVPIVCVHFVMLAFLTGFYILCGNTYTGNDVVIHTLF